jgi:hypothetical protein
MLELRRFTLAEATYCINRWHYSAKYGNGTELFGAVLDDKLIAAAVFFKTPYGDDVIELMATVKNPEIKFYMSQLLKYCRKQLKDKYNLLITFYETTRSKGWQSQGDNWKYGGLVTAKGIENKDNGNQYLYWYPLTEAGDRLACSLKLKSLPYPT